MHDQTMEKLELHLNKLVLLLLLLTTAISARSKGIDINEVINYITVVDDSIELSVKTDCYRGIVFDASPSGRYINRAESEIIHSNRKRRYFDQILNITLENYDKKSGSFFNQSSPYQIKISPNADNLLYFIPTLRLNSLMWHINSLLSKSGFRAFYILNQYGANYKKTKSIRVGEQPVRLTNAIEIGFDVKYSGMIYIPKKDNAIFKQLALKIGVLCGQYRGFRVIPDENGLMISVPPFFKKSSIAP